ncbi:MAG: hypothetical protein KGL74_05330, partial [Elusimicrobia bacterium]|nr:hypothetical protein [Elusimicrobiota bacterium]
MIRLLIAGALLLIAASARAVTTVWTGGGANALASNPSNWSVGVAPSGGDAVVFGSSATTAGCLWDLGGVAVGSVTVTAAFSTSVVLAASMTVTGTFDLAGGTVTSAPGLVLSVGGNLAQTGGRLDLMGSSLTLVAQGFSAAAAFTDARVAGLSVGGVVGAATATVSGALDVSGDIFTLTGATLSLSSSVMSIGGDGPFAGPGAVLLSTSTALVASGSALQRWSPWPGVIGSLSVSNASVGGLALIGASTAPFRMAGGVTVSTGASLSAPGSSLRIGGDWANYGTVSLASATVAFNAAAGTQAVVAGGEFENLTVDNSGAILKLSTAVVVGSSVVVVSGTLDLAGSTLDVRGQWLENPGARVLGGANVTIFDGGSPQTIVQLGGNSFGTFRSASAGGVSISSTLATNGSFLWSSGSLSFSGASLVIHGDMLAIGGAGPAVAGSTVVFAGASTQTVTFSVFGDFVDANASAGGVLLGAAFVNVSSFYVRPGSVLNAGASVLTAAGPVWDTSFSTYIAQSPGHVVRWIPPAEITVAAGSVVNARLSLFAGKTAVLLGDLNIGGAGNVFDPQANSTVVNAPGGSTIAFRGSSELASSAGAGWNYAGDVANSWLVYEGSGTARGVSLSTNAFGTVRVSLNTGADVFTAGNLNLRGRLIVEGGTVRPNGTATYSVGGDVLQTGGVVDFATASSGTVVLVGPAPQTISLLSGSHTLWHLTDASTAAVTAASNLTVGGDFVVAAGTFSAGSGNLALRGRVQVSTGAAFAGQTSTVTLDGASSGVTAQNLAFYGGGSFNGLAINVLTAALQTSATAAVFSDGVAGGTLTVAAGAQLTAADLRLGPGGGAALTAGSSAPGSPWYLDAAAVSSATAVSVSDSNASLGVPILANDGRSTDRGGNTNWNFRPLLLVILPGETFTPSVPPGKTGTPSISTAGVSITATVVAVSSRFEQAYTATGTVTLTSDDSFAVLPAGQPLVGGSTALTFTPVTAEPSPRATHVTATAFFGSGVSTASVVPAGLSRLQIVLFGESALPGSPAGFSGSPFARVKGVPFSATVRAVDAYWNLVTTATDSITLGASASSVTLPAPPALSAGQSLPGGLIVYTTGYFTLSANDLTNSGVGAATSHLFWFVLPSVSSPTGSFYIPTGASLASLGGAISGTAADGSSVGRVRVDVLEVETGFHYDGNTLSFSAALPVFATTTLASPLAPSTSWANPIPDAALISGRHYSATALVDDPTGFTGVAGSTFVVDRSALSFGAKSGQGSAIALPATSSGCVPVIATVTFTAGAAGIGAGGAVAI